MKQIKAKESENDQIYINSLSKLKLHKVPHNCFARRGNEATDDEVDFVHDSFEPVHVTAAMETGKIRKWCNVYFSAKVYKTRRRFITFLLKVSVELPVLIDSIPDILNIQFTPAVKL